MSLLKGDIADYDLVLALLTKHKVRAIVNFAAESHVDLIAHTDENGNYNFVNHVAEKILGVVILLLNLLLRSIYGGLTVLEVLLAGLLHLLLKS